MADKTFNSRIVHKHDVESKWSAVPDFVPKQGEIIVYDIDENYEYERLKVGDGVTDVNSLPFVSDDIRNLIAMLIGDVSVSEQIATSLKDVLYKTPQELTIDEVNQVRENIHGAGQYVTGLTYTPYTVVETGLNTSDHTITETPEEPVVADVGAEIYNDYETNIATGAYTIATGYKTQATGNYARSNGWWTRADGQCSNAEGLLSVAGGNFSHAEGVYTIAAGKAQHVDGTANIEDKNDQYIHISGNGVDQDNRSNAYHLDWDGNGWFAGDIYVGSTSGKDQDEGSKKLATEDYVENLYKTLNSNTVLGFYCIEDVTIVINGIPKIYPANSNVEVKLIENDVFEIIPTSDNSILALNAFPHALGTYYSWLEGVKQFSNILFDMNNVDFYSKWSQGNQGMYQVQFAQYINCIFWSDNPYVADVNKRTNYTLYYTSQLPLCYSNIPDNTFKAFFLAFGVNNDPNWGNPAYRDSFAKATWATQAFSYYGARTIGIFGHDSELFNIVLPKDCRGLFCESTAVENAGTFDAINVTTFGAKSGSWRDAFRLCTSLRNLYIKNLKVNLNVSWSPINYDSISFIISEATNTNAITISVSPYTYNLLSPADFELATSKNITIELITSNYVEDKRLSAIATNLANGNTIGSLRGINTLVEDSSYTMGENAFAIGNDTKASGKNSFASGQSVEANAAFAHAEGFHTNASSPYQHVRGKYNIIDENNTYATIIGNGDAETNRKNIYTLDWDGNAWFAGTITVGTNNVSVITEEDYIIFDCGTVEDIM